MECKFELTYEYSFDGWIIAAWRDEHSAHPFHMEELEVLADSGVEVKLLVPYHAFPGTHKNQAALLHRRLAACVEVNLHSGHSAHVRRAPDGHLNFRT